MKTIKSLAAIAAMTIAATLAGTALAQRVDKGKSAASTDELTVGEIRRVDKVNKGLVIKHGDIKNLQMPGMTMVFRVKQAAMLDQVKEGDKVRFRAEQIGADLVVTEIHLNKP